MASPLDAPSPDPPPDGLYAHRPRGTTAGPRHHRRPFRYREGRRVMSSSMRLTSERPVRGVGISDGKPVGGRSQMTRPGSMASTAWRFF